jgi:kumamolisin
MAAKKRTTVPGSERKALADAKPAGEINPNERIEITVVLRPRPTATTAGPKAAAAVMEAAAAPPAEREYVSREAFAAEHGADPAEAAKVEEFAREHNLTVVGTDLARRTVRLAGTIGDLTAAFRPNLKKVKVGARTMRMRTGGISVPDDLSDAVVAVLGFDNRPAARPRLRPLAIAAAPRNAANGSFTPPEVAKLYHFPPGLDGSGQCIAILELNNFDQQGNPTGTGFTQTDLKKYFTSLGLPNPSVTAVGVRSSDGVGANVPGKDKNADGEVMLDIEVAGGVAPKAKIAVYFALNTDDGFLAALNAALHDDVRKPSVISISWGSAEDLNTDQARAAFNQALQDAATLGVTVTCAAGDNGSSDLPPDDGSGFAHQDGKPHVDFPASSPFALGCGGTKLLGNGSTITSETVWNEGDGATGGGVSIDFPRPAYQAKAKVPKNPKGKAGRGVPDVSGDADPATGYQVLLVGGKKGVIGGTSAVAPLWAGLIALFNQRLAKLGKPPVGFMNPLLYSIPKENGCFRDITDGDNDIEGLGKYKARAGWDACTGLGTPDGAKLLAALGG